MSARKRKARWSRKNRISQVDKEKPQEVLKEEESPKPDWQKEWRRRLRLGQDRVERESKMLASINLARKEGYPNTFKKLFENIGYDYARLKFKVTADEWEKWRA
jgi:hypothetical protein